MTLQYLPGAGRWLLRRDLSGVWQTFGTLDEALRTAMKMGYKEVRLLPCATVERKG